MFKKIILMFIVTSCIAGVIELRQEIENTQQLIYLYQQKLRILKGIYQKTYPDIPHHNRFIKNQRKNITAAIKSSPQLALINKFDYQSLIFQDKYLLSNNQIIEMSNMELAAQFIGEVLIVESNTITTLIGGKVNMVDFKQQNGKTKRQEYFLGLNADKLDSIWHRNYNIKDAEDLLIQWQDNKIYFKGKEVNSITMPTSEKIINIFSLNQYKVIFVSTHRIGIINSRSLQIGQFENAQNITKIKRNSSEQVFISQCYRQDNFIILLLTTGELAKYYNQKIVNIQLVPGLLSQYYDLQHHEIHLQYVHPYLFIANKDFPSIKIFYNQMGRFQQVLQVEVETQKPHFTFFKRNDSYRVVISSSNETKIYELMLPNVEQPVSGTNYFKFIGIFVVILCFVYFKWFKKGNEEEQVFEKRQIGRKPNQFERTKGQVPDRPDPPKQKNRYSQSQVEQFLRKQSRETHKKAN